MAYSGVTLPLTGSGDATATPAADIVDGKAYQAMKLMDGTEGSTVPVPAKGTTPGSTDHGLVVRPIGSTAHTQAVVMSSQQTVTVGNPTTAVSLSSNPGLTSGSSEVALTSAGSTRLVGQVTVANPTTAVNVANPTTSVNVANPTTSVTVTNPTTAVDLTSAGSTRQVGTVNQGTPAGTSADAWWVRTVSTQTGGAGSTTVDLGSGGSTKLVGLVDGQPFSSGQITRTTLNSSAEGQLIAANANRKYAAITNLATAVTLYVGLSTAAVTTLGANAHILIGPLQTFTFGGQVGQLPNYTGPIRCRLNSTSIAGPVIGIEFA